MLILKHNKLPANELFIIERHLVRWLSDRGPKITPEWHVLNYSHTDLYGHLLGLFGKLKIFDILLITPSQLLDFLIDINTLYLTSTPYHSFYHAVDILFMLYYMLMDLKAIQYLKPIDLPILLIAALCHDVGHPGYNNMYQVNSKTNLAKKYNNISVLENHSVDLTIQLLLKHRLFNQLSITLNVQEWKEFMKQLIISTDMIHHFELQDKVNQLEEILHHSWSYDPFDKNSNSIIDNNNNVENNHSDISEDDDESITSTITSDTDSSFHDSSFNHLLTTHQRYDFCSILLHAADISNTLRPWSICKQWSDLIVQEFFIQGDAERSNGLPISPTMDRYECDQPTISLKFSDFIIKPYFEALSLLLPESHSCFISTLAENRLKWLQLKDEEEKEKNHFKTPTSPIVSESFNHPFHINLPTPPIETSFHHLPLSSSTLNRRVSVSAGTITFPSSPDHHLKKSSMKYLQQKRKYKYRITKSSSKMNLQTSNHLHKLRYSMRSASYPIIIPDLLLHNSVNMDVGQISTLFQAQPNE